MSKFMIHLLLKKIALRFLRDHTMNRVLFQAAQYECALHFYRIQRFLFWSICQNNKRNKDTQEKIALKK